MRDDPSCPREPQRLARVAPGATAPTILTEVGNFAMNLLADPFHGLWSDENGIWRISKAGGMPELLLRPGVGVAGMALAPDDLVWTVFAPGQMQTNRISAPLVNTPIFAPVLEGMTGDGTFFYGTYARNLPGAPANIVRMKPNGHWQEVLAKGAVGDVAVDETFIYFVDVTGTKLMKVCKSLE